MPQQKFQTIEEYQKSLTPSSRKIFKEVRNLIKTELSDTEEVISYNIPCFKINGKYLIYIAIFKDHLSIFPASDQEVELFPELQNHRKGKGTYQFKINEEMPLLLIRNIVRERLKNFA